MKGFKAPPTKKGTNAQSKTKHPRMSIGFYKNRGDKFESYLMQYCKDKEISEAGIMHKLFQTISPLEIHGKLLWYALEELNQLDEKALTESGSES